MTTVEYGGVLISVFLLVSIISGYVIRSSPRKPIAVLTIGLFFTSLIAWTISLFVGFGEPLRVLAIQQNNLPPDSNWYKWGGAILISIWCLVLGFIWWVLAVFAGIRFGVDYVSQRRGQERERVVRVVHVHDHSWWRTVWLHVFSIVLATWLVTKITKFGPWCRAKFGKGGR